MTAINTTISLNMASGTNTAGGIDDVLTNLQPTIVDLHNCTIAYNTTTSKTSGSQLSVTGDAVIRFQNTIIAGDTKLGPAGRTDKVGDLVSDGHNICTDNSCNLKKQLGDLPNTDPQLAPLDDYGGPTQTMGLLPDSKAIEAAGADPLVSDDQRGISRPQFDTPDIGAFESQGFSLDIVDGDQQDTPVNTAFPEPLVVALDSADGVPIPQGLQVTFTAMPGDGGASTASKVYTATLDDSGQASVNVRANGKPGDYDVEATLKGADPDVTTPADFSLTNDEKVQPPTISIGDISVTEGSGGTVPAVFTVTLSEASDQDVTVDYKTVAGTAKAGRDYVATSGTLTIPAGALSGTITVLVNGDQPHKKSRSFSVVLSKPTNGKIKDGQGTCTINYSTTTSAVVSSDVPLTEGASGMGEAALTASPSDPTGQPVTVDAAFVEGSAGAGSVAVPVATVPVPMTLTNTSVAAPAAPVAGGGATDVVALALDSLLVQRRPGRHGLALAGQDAWALRQPRRRPRWLVHCGPGVYRRGSREVVRRVGS